MNNDPKRNRRIGVYTTQLNLNDKELRLVKLARELIDKAAKTAKTDEEKKRIAFFLKGFKIFEYFSDIYNYNDLNGSKAAELKSYLKDTIAGDRTMLNVANNANFINEMNLIVDNIVKSKKKIVLKK
ncbi:MAG: hypothetical protein H0V14_03355 [Chitinophagaceae bacterium]|nr:hypothetical protein [Chitinophagaceae bacterium]